MNNLEKLMTDARRVNAQRNADERKLGFATPHDGPIEMLIATAAEAIEAGIKIGDWTCVAEGLAMLLDDKRLERKPR